jgi:elongation factor Ts
MSTVAITAADVNKLRQQTGAGMMDCKNALVEANGDFETAIDILRKKGQKIAAKRGDNAASEGLVFSEVAADGKTGIVVRLNCETDFVAKNDSYVNFVKALLNIAMTNLPSDLDAFKALKFDEGVTVHEKIIEQIGLVGEKLDLSGYEVIKGETVVAYNHPGNQLATLVALNKASETAVDAGRQVAMQVAAMNPIALNKEGVDARTIERELEVGKELAIQEGKPADMADKIAQGRLGKFFKENTLLSQEFIRDNKVTVEEFLNNTEEGMTVVAFSRVSMS